jgi:NADH dehydrogenase [ubiquinone] 1 alpha subcomplex assembly factor 1
LFLYEKNIMQTIMLILQCWLGFSTEQVSLQFNFGSSAKRVNDWRVLSDQVMGGISTSDLVYKEASMQLSGELSLANYGGFSSIKSGFAQYDLSPYRGLRIRYRSDNQTFAFTLESSKNWTRPYYKGLMPVSKDKQWTEATIYFTDFEAYQLGQPTGDFLDPSILKDIVRLGIMTTEKKEGPFFLEVQFVAFIP